VTLGKLMGAVVMVKAAASSASAVAATSATVAVSQRLKTDVRISAPALLA
jgi:hypothetical protein